MPLSTSSTVAAESKLETAIQQTYHFLSVNFPPDDDDLIKKNLIHAWTIVDDTISEAGGSKLKDRLKKQKRIPCSCQVWEQRRARTCRLVTKYGKTGGALEEFISKWYIAFRPFDAD